MRFFLSIVFLLICCFSVAADLIDKEQISKFNETSENLKIVRKFDPQKINTLVVGAGILGSERHFFGSHCQMGDYEKKYVTSRGEILDDREKKFLDDYKIPIIMLDAFNVVHYIFDKDSIFKSKQEALDFQDRRILSPMEVDPETTLFLDINNVMRDPHTYDINDYIHLKSDVFKLTELPFGIKVDKIVIEYLGDCLFADKNFEDLDWSWLKNLLGMLNPNGNVYFEMRVDSMTSQDPKRELTFLPEKLEDVRCSIDWLVNSPLGRKPRAYFEHLYKSGGQVFEDLSKEEFNTLMDYIFPVVVHPRIKISNILREKFEANGFSNVLTRFFKKQSICHISNRYYDTVRVEATFVM